MHRSFTYHASVARKYIFPKVVTAYAWTLFAPSWCRPIRTDASTEWSKYSRNVKIHYLRTCLFRRNDHFDQKIKKKFRCKKLHSAMFLRPSNHFVSNCMVPPVQSTNQMIERIEREKGGNGSPFVASVGVAGVSEREAPSVIPPSTSPEDRTTLCLLSRRRRNLDWHSEPWGVHLSTHILQRSTVLWHSEFRAEKWTKPFGTGYLINWTKQKDVVWRPLQDAASGLHFRPPPERLLRGLPRALPPVLPLLHPPRHLLLGRGEDGGGEAALGLRRGNG